MTHKVEIHVTYMDGEHEVYKLEQGGQWFWTPRLSNGPLESLIIKEKPRPPKPMDDAPRPLWPRVEIPVNHIRRISVLPPEQPAEEVRPTPVRCSSCSHPWKLHTGGGCTFLFWEDGETQGQCLCTAPRSQAID